MTRVLVEALPSSLLHFTLRYCEQLRELPDLSSLANLKTLSLTWCEQLCSVPSIARLTNLESLDLSHCPKLKSLPSLYALGKLAKLNVRGCSALYKYEHPLNLTRNPVSDFMQAVKHPNIFGQVYVELKYELPDHLFAGVPVVGRGGAAWMLTAGQESEEKS